MLALVCVLTFLHYAGAQMWGPVLPLYAAAHGASPTGVGLIIGAHMAVAAVGSIPFGRASDRAFVAISTALATSATPAARGLVMGGYSTSLYLGLGLGSFALGPVITHHGYGAGFVAGAGAGVLGAALAAALWTRAGTLRGKAGTSGLLRPDVSFRRSHRPDARGRATPR